MALETIDYTAVLADLEAKRVAIDNAIAGVRQMLNLGAEQGVSPSATASKNDQPTAEVRSDSFFGMTMPDAITKFLGMAKRPQSVSEITQALLNGGFPTTAKNLMPSVGSTLSRMKVAGDVVSVHGKWGLSSWYPGMRKEKPETTSKSKRGRKRGRPKVVKTETVKAKPETKPNVPKTPTDEQIERMKALHGTGKTNGEIAKELGVNNLAVWRALKSVAATKHAQAMQ